LCADLAPGAEPTRLSPGGLEEMAARLAEADLLVNTTSVGLAGEAWTLPLDPLPDRALVVDIVYAPLETPLLRAARARGLRTLDGLWMLLHQARPGFAAWFGRDPEADEALHARIAATL
ncbi:MAG: shikimate dehydrogenase, partial [Alphaproteobacteria bacterium]|nr:shikimate dehydrogenase [Alphaproteobacteria bacterium]